MDWVIGTVTTIGLALVMFAGGPAWIAGVILVVVGAVYFLVEKLMGAPIDAWINRQRWLP